MIDPAFSLAISVHGAPGVFAVLAGSGLSRRAGIKTGWEITLDLAGRVAAAAGEDPGPDAAAWFGKRFGKEPGYSELLSALSPSRAVRARLLQEFFEPTDDERAQGLKIPTAAHKAIAELASGGYIKLIVTTNFDRLIETALDQQGIAPVVINSPDAVAGAPPLDHSPCTVVKLHGDYRDPRILNTEKELASYDARVNSYLDRIFDEYGWIVVGWSAEWDTALRAAIERSKTRRYPMYWATRHEPTGLAKDLIKLRGAEVISIADAETFLPQVSERVKALADLQRPHPLSVAAAVAMAKQYLAEPRFRIRLSDLVMEETERTFAAIEKLASPGGNINEAEIRPQVAAGEAATEQLAALLAMGAYWGDTSDHRLWVRALERLANPESGRQHLNPGFELRFLPALIAMFASGIAAVASGHFDAIRALLLDARIHGSDGDTPLADDLSPIFVLHRPLARMLPGLERHKTPVSDELERFLRPTLKHLLLSEDEYLSAFDRFEYILGLTRADLDLQAGKSAWGPVGCWGWRSTYLDRALAEFKTQGNDWAPLRAGLLGGQPDRVIAAQKVLAPIVSSLQWE